MANNQVPAHDLFTLLMNEQESGSGAGTALEDGACFLINLP